MEVARNAVGAVLVRDSEDQDGPALAVTEEAWPALVQGVRQGQFDI